MQYVCNIYAIDDARLPDNVKNLDDVRRRQWVHIWNSGYVRCKDGGGSTDFCETKAFKQANGVVFQEDMASNAMVCFVSGTAIQPKRKKIGGIDYLIAPIVMVKEGILNGEYVTLEEISAHYQAWNGAPIVIYHPKKDGVNVSANDPVILSRTKIGCVFNTYVDGDALKGEVWVDLALAQAVKRGEEVVDRLLKGKPIEVSTAYYRDREMIDGSFDGDSYSCVAHNLRPDHLAMLLDAKGACSWADGCGTPRVNEEGTDVTEIVLNVLSKARRPSYTGTETTSWDAVSKSFGAFMAGYYKNTGAAKPDEAINRVEDAPQAMKNWIASKALVGDPGSNLESDLIAFPVVNPGTNKLNAGAVRNAIARAPVAKISSSTKASIQDVGRSLLEKEFGVKGDEDESHTLSRVREAWNTIAQALGINKEVMSMEELIKQIVDSGMGLTANDLEGVPEELVKKLAAFCAKPAGEEPIIQEQEPPCQDASGEPPEPALNQEQEPPEEDVGDEMVMSFMEAVGKRGGVERVLSLLDGLQANEDAQRGKIVAELVTNDACAFSEEQLKDMNLDTLMSLRKSLIPADYSGQGGGERVVGKEEMVELPSMFA